MRRFSGLAIMSAVWVAAGAVHAAAPSAAEAAALAAYKGYDEAWRTFDAGKVTDAFADDFEWTNEVGLRFTDKAKLKPFLTHLFRDADYRAGKLGALVIRSIRVVAPDVVVISSSEETNGQIDSATGKAVRVLHTNEMAVLKRRGGRWRIVDILDSDESHGI